MTPKSAAACIALAALAACRPTAEGRCAQDSDCRTDAVCAPEGICVAVPPSVTVSVTTPPDGSGWYSRSGRRARCPRAGDARRHRSRVRRAHHPELRGVHLHVPGNCGGGWIHLPRAARRAGGRVGGAAGVRGHGQRSRRQPGRRKRRPADRRRASGDRKHRNRQRGHHRRKRHHLVRGRGGKARRGDRGVRDRSGRRRLVARAAPRPRRRPPRHAAGSSARSPLPAARCISRFRSAACAEKGRCAFRSWPRTCSGTPRARR